MADRQMAYSITMVVVVLAVLSVLAVAAWRMGLFDRSSAADEQATYKAGVTDASGGELVVTDPSAPRVEDLELPKTPMTPMPRGKAASPSAAARDEAE